MTIAGEKLGGVASTPFRVSESYSAGLFMIFAHWRTWQAHDPLGWMTPLVNWGRRQMVPERPPTGHSLTF